MSAYLVYTHQFQSTLPAWGATTWRVLAILMKIHFNPRSPHGERLDASTIQQNQDEFQSTLPAWGATRNEKGGETMNGKFQSTLPAWGATMGVWILNCAFGFQSTLPAWGATLLLTIDSLQRSLFQSTLPAWGATIFRIGAVTTCIHFNPRSPHGERHSLLACQRMNTGISIHAPRMGSDNKHSHSNCFTCIFQSTLPAWGATLLIDTTLFRKDNFNPRSPHGERQATPVPDVPSFAYFNPRSPHGERHDCIISQIIIVVFQSTLPAWGATRYKMFEKISRAISIHAPRMGSDGDAEVILR